jgi:catechol 2,3-dioxygenase-like lactoylglutathione lyase family enzyme
LGEWKPSGSVALACAAIVILAGLIGATGPAWAAVVEVERIGLTVTDLDRTERFYRDGLGFVTVGRRHVEDPAVARLLGVTGAVIDSLVMRLGSNEVEFMEYRPPGRPYPEGSRSPDLWFQHFAIVVSDMDKAYARLRHVAFMPISSGGPQTLPERDGRVRAFKFRDPDGHPLELLYSHRGRAGRSGIGQPMLRYSSASITPQSPCPTQLPAKRSMFSCSA